jgi:hypothetical protein
VFNAIVRIPEKVNPGGNDTTERSEIVRESDREGNCSADFDHSRDISSYYTAFEKHAGTRTA